MNPVKPLISVIIPVYNVEKYLERCVTSVRNQTCRNIQIILIDDGSTDLSGVLCDKLKADDRRIEVIHRKNGGLSSARNAGLEAAKGDWIAFLDSDDWIEAEFCEVLLTLAQSTDSSIASCNTVKFDVDGNTLTKRVYDGTTGIFTYEEMLEGLLTQEKVRFEVWNKLWSRELIADVRFIEKQVSEDIHFDRILFEKARKMAFVDLPLHHYLVGRPGSTCAEFRNERINACNEFDEWIKQLKHSKLDESANIICSIAVNFSMRMYGEAVDTNQEQSVKKLLYEKCSKYIQSCDNLHYFNLKTRIKIFLFKNKVSLFHRLRKSKK